MVGSLKDHKVQTSEFVSKDLDLVFYKTNVEFQCVCQSKITNTSFSLLVECLAFLMLLKSLIIHENVLVVKLLKLKQC